MLFLDTKNYLNWLLCPTWRHNQSVNKHNFTFVLIYYKIYIHVISRYENLPLLVTLSAWRCIWVHPVNIRKHNYILVLIYIYVLRNIYMLFLDTKIYLYWLLCPPDGTSCLYINTILYLY